MKNPFLIGKKIYLRPLEIEDSDFICLGENDEKIRDALFLALPMSPSTSKEKIQKQIDAPDTILFTIVLQENETPVGQTGLFRVDFVSRADKLCFSNAQFKPNSTSCKRQKYGGDKNL